MATGEGSVFRGAEGTGEAQIYGREGNPVRAFMNISQMQHQRKLVEEAKALRAKQERDKALIEMMDVDPEKTFQPFNQQVIDATEAHRRRFVERARNSDHRDPAFQAWNKNEWARIDDLARKGEYIKEKLGKTLDLIDKSPYLQKEYYAPKLADQYMDAYGNGKPLDQVDVAAIEQVYERDPMGFESDKYAKDYMKSIKENLFNWKREQYTSMGLNADDVEVKMQGELYTPDQTTKSGFKEGPDGVPIINITPDFQESFLSNANARRYYETVAKNEGISVTDAIERAVKPNTYYQKQVKPIYRNDSRWMNEAKYHGGIGPDKAPLATKRWENIENLVNAFVDQDGNIQPEASPAAREALGHIKKNGKIGGKDIVDATLVPGTNKPGTSTVLGMTVNNSPSDRIVFATTAGQKRSTKPHEINLNDEGAGPAINALFEENKSEGKFTIGYDQLKNFKGVEDNSMYRGKESKDLLNQQFKEQENKIVDDKWLKGEGAEDLVGRSYNGKQIADAKPMFEGGMFGIGKKFHGWDISYVDGTVDEIPANREELASVFTGKKKQTEVPIVDSQEAYDALPAGADYVDVEGKPKVKGGLSAKGKTFDGALKAFKAQMGREPSKNELEKIKAKYK